MRLVWNKYLGNSAEYCFYGDAIAKIEQDHLSCHVTKVDLLILLNGEYKIIASFSDTSFSKQERETHPSRTRMEALVDSAKQFAEDLLFKHRNNLDS